jgi:hypothetical protein
MAATFTKIADVTVGSGGAASIDFSSIPSTYTDLCVKFSGSNSTGSPQVVLISFNSSTSSFTQKYVEGNGSSASSGSIARFVASTADISNTFSNAEIYIPNYASANNKSFSGDSVTENNGNPAYATLNAGLWSNTSAINQVTLTQNGGNFRQYTTATLYGISKS